MSTPSPTYASPKPTFPLALLWGFLITVGVFFLGHFINYKIHLDGVSGYSLSMKEALFIIASSFAYAFLYMRASYNWITYKNGGFIPYPGINAEGKYPSTFLYRLGNSLLFSFFAWIIIVISIYFTGVLISTVYVYLLEGIRGAVPPPDTVGAGLLAAQFGVAGLGMELVGKTETPPR